MFNGLASNWTGDVCEKWRRKSAEVLGDSGRAVFKQRRALTVGRRTRMVWVLVATISQESVPCKM